jgi:hypothetical protein
MPKKENEQTGSPAGLLVEMKQLLRLGVIRL